MIINKLGQIGMKNVIQAASQITDTDESTGLEPRTETNVWLQMRL